ncbi:MAG: DNA gyrase subunit B, partial [Planctomycetales bacterium]|nr:DNA gyrase subunit B [Planctomycetales bacterium]
HVFVAQPPLFRVRRGKKETYYVQTEDEMRTQLMERGMDDCALDAGADKVVAGEQFTRLCRTLSGMDEAITALERRGIGLKLHAERADAESKRLPVYHVFLGREERWFATRALLDEFLQSHQTEAGEPKVVDNGAGDPTAEENGSDDPATRLHITELHEVRTINRGLTDLAELGFDVQSLIPQVRTGRQDSRYTLRRGESEIGIEDLRGLLGAVRAAGEKGLTITRFKGLGEMNAEELRDTTLMPENRTLLQVTMADAGAADEMFRVLMGDKVEPRREFIEKHALDVRNLDV